jgi:drug/metabolite transporter (DMT)-like permease
LAHAAVAGLLMQMAQFGGFYTAMRCHVSGAVISLIQGLNPVVIALLAGVVLGERVAPRQWLGFGIGGLGVLLAVTGAARLSVAGLGWCALGLFGLSLGTLYQKKFTPGIDSRAATAVHVLASAPVAGVLVLVGGNTRVTHPGSLALALVWMVVINSMCAFLLLNAMLSRWETTRVSRLFFAVPAVTTALAWVVIGQPVHLRTVAGLAVGVLGMALAARAAPGQPESLPAVREQTTA